jgi:hypothetical protein
MLPTPGIRVCSAGEGNMNEDPRIYAALTKWWRTKNAKAALRRAEKAKAERLKLLRKLAQPKNTKKNGTDKHRNR